MTRPLDIAAQAAARRLWARGHLTHRSLTSALAMPASPDAGRDRGPEPAALPGPGPCTPAPSNPFLGPGEVNR